jgi:L-asparaginase
MKLIIHGGFSPESATNLETKVAKQNALERIVRDAYQYLLTHSGLKLSFMRCHF